MPGADRDLEALRSIVEVTAGTTGQAFLRTLVEHLAKEVGARHAFVAEFLPPGRVRTLAYWSDGAIAPNIEFDLPGTPCEEVINGGLCFYPSGLQERYPNAEAGFESYLGVPLQARDGRILGHLCVLDESPLPDEPRRLAMFHIFAARAAAELDRIRLENDLRDKEDRLRDLFDEAPIAYVHEDRDTRFIRANRAAREILGISPEEVTRTTGASLVPDTPEAKRRLREAVDRVGRGTDTGGAVIELRRKDSGKAIWVRRWSKPGADGSYTRTMFIDITERVLMEQAQAKLAAQNNYLLEELKEVHNFEEIIGSSAGLLKVMDKVRRVAPTDASVLITGESGTGKELIARALHSASGRADKPFIKVNCAALPVSLVESELFGHERGAFSGAIQRRIGRFELAHTGTIFLDEIGEMPMDVQVKLLRVLQEREFERIGGGQAIKTDVRLIAATNRDLPRSIGDGDFRADLFYRLNVFPIEMPPLRERRGDIPLLANFFVQKYAPRVGRRVDSIEPDSLRRLTEYPWPGNIRELENIIERSLILNGSPILHIETDVLPKGDGGRPQAPRAAGADLDSIQREHILSTLREVGWVIEGVRGAALRLGLKPGTLRHRMKKLGISRAANP